MTRSLALTVALVLLICAASTEARAGEPEIEKGDVLYSCGKAHGKIAVRFKPQVELEDLVAWAMGFTCKNFVYTAKIGALGSKASIVVPRMLSVEEAWRVFLVALETMNLTVVPKGQVLQIVEAAQAKAGPLPLYLRGTPSKRSQVVRKLFRPRYASSGELARAMELLKSKQGDVSELGELGLVLVTDFADHIARMTELVDEVDQPRGDEAIYALAVRRVDAVELVRVLEDLLGSPRGVAAPPTRGRRAPRGKPAAGSSSERGDDAAAPSKLVADARTNTLLMVASEPAYQRVRAIVGRLDVAVDGEASGSLHLYALENADAEEVAKTLQMLLSSVPHHTAAAARGGPAPSPGAAPTVEGDVRVAFDKATNSLLVAATTRDYLSLSQLIRQLDRARRQVYIEATVFEVSSELGRQLGVAFHGGTKRGDNLLLAGSQNDLSTIDPGGSLTKLGMVGAVFGKSIPGIESLLGQSLPSFGVLIQALAGRSIIDILSSPHILTADNQRALISVGENIPYKSRVTSLPSGTDSATSSLLAGQSIERQNVALTLELTPHVSGDDSIRLDLKLEKSDLKSDDFEGLGPSWTTSKLENSVVVHDQETLVIGGMVSDKNETYEKKVPLLGDLPLLGVLFRSSNKKKTKVNLLIVITPHIISDRIDAQRILDRRMRERDEFIGALDSFERSAPRHDVDYRSKRGLVAEIERTVAGIERERVARRRLEQEVVAPADGRIEPVAKAPAAGGAQP